ncbi:nucleoside phosphorylase [Vicingaceae bacterium]|nr:nucleoside phosphorylase [Vicingaceae bacterium]MDB4060649.1 nucleoside phosphorylase [Vicingaceae bacterium]
MIHPSELILNPDGSIYHLALKPEQVASKIIVAGDPQRIATISAKFDSIECKVKNREFITHTGSYKGQRVTALATGIGTDNIDIVLNELDALVNCNLQERTVKEELTSLEIVRIGTCGSIQESVPADEVVVSTHAIGLDGLMNFYEFEMDAEEQEMFEAFKSQTSWNDRFNQPYLVKGSSALIAKVGKGFHPGVTMTANGFYAPQGRRLRLLPRHQSVNDDLRKFDFKGNKIVNYEMETSALYGLSGLMGHEACTVCAVVANRYANSFSKDYKPVMNKLIDTVLERLTA